jgi:hypothetical protein
MTAQEAVARLVFHTLPEPGSFLGMLRPYQGLHQDVLDDVLDALRACVDVLTEPRLDRDLITAPWASVARGRSHPTACCAVTG